MCKDIVYLPASPCQQHDHYANINRWLNIKPHTQLIVIKPNLAVAMLYGVPIIYVIMSDCFIYGQHLGPQLS